MIPLIRRCVFVCVGQSSHCLLCFVFFCLPSFLSLTLPPSDRSQTATFQKSHAARPSKPKLVSEIRWLTDKQILGDFLPTGSQLRSTSDSHRHHQLVPSSRADRTSHYFPSSPPSGCPLSPYWSSCGDASCVIPAMQK